MGPPNLFGTPGTHLGSLGFIWYPPDYFEPPELFVTPCTHLGTLRFIWDTLFLFETTGIYLEPPGLFGAPFGTPRTFWDLFWDPLEYLGPPVFILDPRDSFGTPGTFSGPPGLVLDPRDLFGTTVTNPT